MCDASVALRWAPKLILAAACTVQPLHAATVDAAKSYPSKPIRFIVNSLAGGGSDITARAIAQKLTEAWGRQVIVDNRPGASGAIAVEFTAKAVPDGYTICLIASSQILNPALNPRISDDFTRDIAAISQASTQFFVIYHNPSLPVKSVKELIAQARAQPGKLNYGTAGNASIHHLAWELFNHMTGAKLVHVPYKGGAAVVVAALSGDVQFGMGSLITLRPHLSSGRLRALATTAKTRSPAMPELPTVAEAGVPGYEAHQWYGVVTAANVPVAIIGKLNAGIVQSLKSPEVVQRLTTDGSTPVGSSPGEFGVFIKSEITKWRKLVKDAGLVLH